MTARPLGTSHTAAVVVGSMIGTGVFMTTGLILPDVPSPALVLAVWAAAGLLALCGAAVYAELGTMMPRVGGEYVYLSRAYGPALGFLSGWVALTAGFAAPTAAGAIGFATYLHAVVPGLSATPIAVAVVIVFTAAHMADVRFGARLQSALAVVVVAVIVLFVVAAFTVGHGNWSNVTSSLTIARPAGGIAAAGGVAVALVQVSYSYSGWNGAAYVAGEVRDPGRTLPRALVLATGLVTALYLALNLVFLYATPAAALAGKKEVAHAAAVALFGPGGAVLISSLVALASAGFVSAMLMSGPRVVVAMAHDGVFFRALGRTNARGAPTLAVGLQGALAIIAVLTATYDRILVYVGFALTLNAAAAVVAAFVLRRRDPAAERPFRTPLWPATGLLFVALSAFMLVFAVRERPLETGAAAATLIAGGVAYAMWHRRRR